MVYSLKDRLSLYTGEFITFLLVLQPVLDVISYFAVKTEATVITTVIRTILLAVVCCYGFVLSGQKNKYLMFYAVLAIFWILHMLNCLRIGYQDPMADFAEYLKLVQFPLWCFSFVTIFKSRDDIQIHIPNILVLSFFLIVLVIFLSFITNRPGFTYDYPDRNIHIGLLGWFSVQNAQSTIVSVLVPFILLWSLRSENILIFTMTTAISFGLLYMTGTRFAYYAAIIIAVAFILLILMCREYFLFCLPIITALILFFLLKDVSPMAEKESVADNSFRIYQERTEEIMGNDIDYIYQEGEEIPEDIRNKITQVYTDIYAQEGVFGNLLLSNIIDRFGLEKVMEVYDYSVNPKVLYNMREKRIKCMELIWNEQDILTKLLGFEFSESVINGEIHSPENDLPLLFSFYGILGGAIYVLFVLYFILIAARKMLFGFWDFLSMEIGVYFIAYFLLIGAALICGHTLRVPSANVYLSLSAALIYARVYPNYGRRFQSLSRRSSVVYIKKI
jgi:hypothetical protein